MTATIIVVIAVLIAAYFLRKFAALRIAKAEADATALKASAAKVVADVETDAKAEATKVEAHL